MQFDFDDVLDYPLPEGFHFVKPKKYDRDKIFARDSTTLYRRTKILGATHMTGGENEFYKRIGYKPAVKWTYWQKR